jgi:hypothetical protein
LVHNVFESHSGHSAFSARKNVFTRSVFPFKIRLGIFCNKKRTVALRQLTENDGIVFLTFNMAV